MTLYEFNTANFRVVLTAEYDQDPDLSWRDAEQIAYDAEHGVEYFEFSAIVYHKDTGAELGRDNLGGSGYSNPRDFVTDHRDPDPMNRNCSIMRAANGGNVAIGHYFPDMIREAIREARQNLDKLQAIEVRS